MRRGSRLDCLNPPTKKQNKWNHLPAFILKYWSACSLVGYKIKFMFHFFAALLFKINTNTIIILIFIIILILIHDVKIFYFRSLRFYFLLLIKLSVFKIKLKMTLSTTGRFINVSKFSFWVKHFQTAACTHAHTHVHTSTRAHTLTVHQTHCVFLLMNRKISKDEFLVSLKSAPTHSSKHTHTQPPLTQPHSPPTQTHTYTQPPHTYTNYITFSTRNTFYSFWLVVTLACTACMFGCVFVFGCVCVCVCLSGNHLDRLATILKLLSVFWKWLPFATLWQNKKRVKKVLHWGRIKQDHLVLNMCG